MENATGDEVAKNKELVHANLDRISMPHAAVLYNYKMYDIHKKKD